MVWAQLAGQPDGLEVDFGRVLQPAARVGAPEVAPQVEQDEGGRGVALPPARPGVARGEPERRQVEGVDEGVERANRAVLVDVVLDARR